MRFRDLKIKTPGAVLHYHGDDVALAGGEGCPLCAGVNALDGFIGGEGGEGGVLEEVLYEGGDIGDRHGKPELRQAVAGFGGKIGVAADGIAGGDGGVEVLVGLGGGKPGRGCDIVGAGEGTEGLAGKLRGGGIGDDGTGGVQPVVEGAPGAEGCRRPQRQQCGDAPSHFGTIHRRVV